MVSKGFGRRPWLMRQLRERYDHPLEVGAYVDQVAGGLLPEEDALISRLCPHPCRILDVGCGAGREAFALEAKGHELVGADISHGMLDAARRFATERKANISWLWMRDPLKLPVSDAAFDRVLALAQLLSHIPGSDARVAFLTEVRRVLAPEGVLVATVTDREASAHLYGTGEKDDGDGTEEPSALERAAGWEEGDLLVLRPSEAELDTPLFFHLHTPDEIADELQAAGLKLVELARGNELSPNATPDAEQYPFIVARPDV